MSRATEAMNAARKAAKSLPANPVDQKFSELDKPGQHYDNSDLSSETHPQAHAIPAEPKSPINLITERKAPSTAEVPAPSVAKRNLLQDRLWLRGYLHNYWDATIERDTPFEAILQPDFWKHVAQQFKPHDEIIAIEETGKWYARLLVLSADRLWAKVYPLEHSDLTAGYKNMPKTQEEEYDVRWTAVGKYGIVKKGQEGLAPLKDGFTTKLDALIWLDGHLKSLNT